MRLALRFALTELQSEVLEDVATGLDFTAIAHRLCLRAEAMAPGTSCTLLSVDADGRVHPVSAPSLPKAYSDALDGLAIGPEEGSCGAAAYTGRPVEVASIAMDPRWRKYAALVAPLGLKACWSSPIKAMDGNVVATFAFYYRQERGPTAIERHIVKTCVHLCSIAIERDRANARMQHLAFHDQLTGLKNRHAFDQQLAQLSSAAQENIGLIIADIDNLKLVNDTLGHAAGDALIRQVAQRMATVAPGKIYRLGGDEFAMLTQGFETIADLQAIADEMRDVAQEQLVVGGSRLVPQITMGGTMTPASEPSPPLETQRKADFALYHAKESHRGGLVFYDVSLETSIGLRSKQVLLVRTALDENRIFPHFQPILSLQSGKIVGLEALARMRDDEGNVISAGQFAMGLTESQNAHRLTDQMLPQVLSQMRGWADQGIFLGHVGFNLSMHDFRRGDLEQFLLLACDQAGVSPECLQIEVTETVLMSDHVRRTIANLRKAGLGIALDDFGTGFGSLCHLRDFPPDYIKMDKSFVQDMLTDPSSAAIVQALIAIAKKLGLGIIAEGIETEAQSLRLIQLGCPMAQGYLYARPADGETTEALLRKFGTHPVSVGPASAAQGVVRLPRPAAQRSRKDLH